MTLEQAMMEWLGRWIDHRWPWWATARDLRRALKRWSERRARDHDARIAQIERDYRDVVAMING